MKRAPDGAIEVTFNAPADLGAGIYFSLGEDRTQRLDLTDYYNGYINFDVYFDEAHRPLKPASLRHIRLLES